MKKKKKTKKWEKIFTISSTIIIIIIIGIYAYRTIYYYKKINYIKEDSKLIDIITNQNNVVYSGDGLYKENEMNAFYYYGKNTNNYLLYSGLLWRIISVDSTSIKIITDDNITSLVWGINTTFEKSNIYKWLNTNKILNVLTNTNDIITNSWCNDIIDINSYNCQNQIIAKVGLLTTEEYLKAGGINSYLNNNSYFWTLNVSDDKKAYYIHNEGGLNNEVSSGTTYYSYGVRPIIYLNSNMPYLGGEGTSDNPYIIEKNIEINLNEHPVGSYVTYQGYNWKIMEINEDYTKLILDGYVMNDNNEPLKLAYNKINTYLNSTFINTLEKDDLVKIDFDVTEYNIDNSYNYDNKKNTISSYVSIPSIGDLFTTDYESIWLNSYANQKQKLIYTTTKGPSLFSDLESSENYIRPVIAVKNSLIIASGDGTKNNPFIIGEK